MKTKITVAIIGISATFAVMLRKSRFGGRASRPAAAAAAESVTDTDEFAMPIRPRAFKQTKAAGSIVEPAAESFS